MTTPYDEEIPAGYQDADLLQAQYERESAEYARTQTRARKVREADGQEAAARICPHGSGYTLGSPAAADAKDPDPGPGFRCTDQCEAVLDETTREYLRD